MSVQSVSTPNLLPTLQPHIPETSAEKIKQLINLAKEEARLCTDFDEHSSIAKLEAYFDSDQAIDFILNHPQLDTDARIHAYSEIIKEVANRDLEQAENLLTLYIAEHYQSTALIFLAKQAHKLWDIGKARDFLTRTKTCVASNIAAMDPDGTFFINWYKNEVWQPIINLEIEMGFIEEAKNDLRHIPFAITHFNLSLSISTQSKDLQSLDVLESKTSQIVYCNFSVRFERLKLQWKTNTCTSEDTKHYLDQLKSVTLTIKNDAPQSDKLELNQSENVPAALAFRKFYLLLNIHDFQQALGVDQETETKSRSEIINELKNIDDLYFLIGALKAFTQFEAEYLQPMQIDTKEWSEIIDKIKDDADSDTSLKNSCIAVIIKIVASSDPEAAFTMFNHFFEEAKNYRPEYFQTLCAFITASTKNNFNEIYDQVTASEDPLIRAKGYIRLAQLSLDNLKKLRSPHTP